MKKIILFIIVSSLSFQLSMATKRALIIAIGAYPAKTGWSAISSVNDVPLIQQALATQGFAEDDIVVLTDEQATKTGIIRAMTELQATAEEGDIVVIHYSGHGQQIFDDNSDEIDGKDESIVPYDAFAKYTHNYAGQNHIRDDELGNIIANFRNKLGKDGQLLFIMDSCHSGSTTRGAKARGGQATFAPPNWTPQEADKTKGSGLIERTQVTSEAAPFVMISGASADELNYEYQGCGSLSYAFSKAMTDLGSDFTFRQLFSSIAANMNVISPKQTPTIEGDVDYLLFKGEYVKQQPYFTLSRIVQPDVIQIAGGQLQRLFKQTTLFVLPAGTTTVDPEKVIAKGTITNAKFNEAVVKLDRPLEGNNEKNYWVFVDQPAYGDIAIQVYLHPSVDDASVKTAISTFLSENHLGKIVTDTLEADVIVEKRVNTYELTVAQGEAAFNQAESSRGEDLAAEINDKLFNFAQGQYLKKLSLKNYEYEFEFKLIPIDYDIELGIAGDLKPDTALVNEAGIFEVDPASDYVVLQVTNKSDRPLYFSIIEINTKGEIASFMPNDNCPLTDEERRIAPGQTMTFSDCVFSFGPPYERLILKGFATSTPINFQSTVATRGEGTRSANQNPLERFIQQSYTQSRGSSGTSVTGKVDGYSSEFVYEIVKR